MRGLLRDERGFAAAVALLIVVPLLLAVLAAAVGAVHSVSVSDVDLQEAVACAAKAAAMSVEPASQAAGTPRVATALAHSAFRSELARNMGLDPATLAPLPGSFYARAPRYWLVVYNGYEDYSPRGAYGARLFYFDGSAVSEQALPASGFPASFAISPSGVSPGSGGTYAVTLESPGAVALVEAEAKKIVGDVPVKAQRWAAARVVCKEGACRVI